MQQKIRILIADDHLIVRTGLAALLGTERDFQVVGQAKNGIEAVREADVLILGNQPLPAAVINDCYRLKMISVAFTGVDHVALDSAEIRKITVCNAAGYATEAVAEHTFGLIFALYRRLIGV